MYFENYLQVKSVVTCRMVLIRRVTENVPGPMFTKKSKMRIRIRIYFKKCHNLTKYHVNWMKFLPYFPEGKMYRLFIETEVKLPFKSFEILRLILIFRFDPDQDQILNQDQPQYFKYLIR